MKINIYQRVAKSILFQKYYRFARSTVQTMSAADLWARKKKLTRKERFRLIDSTLSKKKDREEDIDKLLSQKEEQARKLQSEENRLRERGDSEREIRQRCLPSIDEKFRQMRDALDNHRAQIRREKTRDEHSKLENLDRIVPWMNERASELRENVPTLLADLRVDVDDCRRMLNTLTEYIEDAHIARNVENWYECRRELRDVFYDRLERVGYEIAKNIEKHMSFVNADEVKFVEQTPFFSHILWTIVDRPRTSKDDKFPLVYAIEECGVVVTMPKSFLNKYFIVQCLVVFDDYFTADCRTARTISPPAQFVDTLSEYCDREWRRSEQLKLQREVEERNLKIENNRRRQTANKMKNVPHDESLSDTKCGEESSTENVDSQPKDLEYLSKFIALKKSYAKSTIEEEKYEMQNTIDYFTVRVDEFECNMKKYTIVGGVYSVELHKQPYQPKFLKDGAVMRLIEGEDRMQKWNYFETYEPPIIKGGTLKQSTDDDDEEAENTPEGVLLSKLILIVIKLPDHVLWFDTPIPVHWDYDRNYWSTKYIYDVKFNEEKQTVSFRAGKMTVFGLATATYNNFPFQSWELKRTGDEGVTEFALTLTTSNVTVELLIRRQQMCLASLENASTTKLQQMMGIFHEPSTLIRMLKTAGLNVFPSDDGFLYVDGVQVKHRPTEDHLYFCITMLVFRRYQFSWSRWNSQAGCKKFVLHMRSPKSNAEKQNDLLVITDQRAYIAETGDVGQTFADGDNANRKFYPDLSTLVEDVDGEKLFDADDVDVTFVTTIFYVLSATRFLSYS